jgi:hypothetical protein
MTTVRRRPLYWKRVKYDSRGETPDPIASRAPPSSDLPAPAELLRAPSLSKVRIFPSLQANRVAYNFPPPASWVTVAASRRELYRGSFVRPGRDGLDRVKKTEDGSRCFQPFRPALSARAEPNPAKPRPRPQPRDPPFSSVRLGATAGLLRTARVRGV